MHISEGVLSVPVLAAGWIVSGGLLACSMRAIPSKALPRMAVFASAFFLASLVRVPIGASSAHFALLGLMGMTLGWGAFPAIFLALALQALLFQFGGLLALGVNSCIMGLPALAVFVLFSKASRSSGLWVRCAAFAAGFVAIALGVGLACVSLMCSNAALETSARLLALANLPLAILEGLVTLFAVLFLQKVAPDMLAAAPAGTVWATTQGTKMDTTARAAPSPTADVGRDKP